MGINAGGCAVVISYYIDEFADTWSEELLVVQTHIYLGVCGQGVNTDHFPFEPKCEDYSFFNQVVAGFEDGLDSIVTIPFKTLELDVGEGFSFWFNPYIRTK